MKGHNGKFRPFDNLTYAEAITVISRIANIRNTTTQFARWTPYREYINKLGILKNTKINDGSMDTNITR